MPRPAARCGAGEGCCSMVTTAWINSPVGRLLLAAEGERLCGLWIEGQKYFAATLTGPTEERPDLPVFGDAARWLEAYFAGQKPDPNQLPLAPQGSAFRRVIWALLCEIPCGALTNLWRPRGKGGRPAGTCAALGAGGGRRGRAQPDLDHHPLPPGGRGGRQPDRLRRRPCGQAAAAGPRGGGPGGICPAAGGGAADGRRMRLTADGAAEGYVPPGW